MTFDLVAKTMYILREREREREIVTKISQICASVDPIFQVCIRSNPGLVMYIIN